MAQWYHFYHREEDAEIKVGLYDRWLCQVEFGPTQAERFLLHTEMMEMAHERRFVVAQGRANMMGFEKDHSRRMSATIEHLERNFIKRSYDPCDATELEDGMRRHVKRAETADGAASGDFALIGLMRGSADGVSRGGEDVYLDRFRRFMPTLLHSLQLMSEMSVLDPRYEREAHAIIDADEINSDGYQEDEQQHRAIIEDLARKRMRRAVDSPRKIKEVRLRKVPKLQYVQQTKAVHRKGYISASRPTNMALDVMLN